MIPIRCRLLLSAAAALTTLMVATSTQADTLIFYTTGDATLDELNPNDNNGWDTKTVARNTGYGPWELDPLVRFDISWSISVSGTSALTRRLKSLSIFI